MLHLKSNTSIDSLLFVLCYETHTHFGLGVFWYRTCVVSDIDTTPMYIITLNYVIFSNY